MHFKLLPLSPLHTHTHTHTHTPAGAAEQVAVCEDEPTHLSQGITIEHLTKVPLSLGLPIITPDLPLPPPLSPLVVHNRTVGLA